MIKSIRNALIDTYFALLFLFSNGVADAMSSLTAASLLVFSLLYTPCVVAVAFVKRELGGKWAFFVVLWQCMIAWLMAFLVHIVGLMAGMI